jgi:hypothetical protein
VGPTPNLDIVETARRKICANTELFRLIRSRQSLIKLSDNPTPHIIYNKKAEADGVKHAQNHNDYTLHEQEMNKYSILKLVFCSRDECVSAT